MTPITPGNQKPKAPKRPYLNAVNQLIKRDPSVRALFYHDGHVRSITTDSETVLFDEPMLGKPVEQARKFLDVPEIYSALGLQHFKDLQNVEIEEGPLGSCVRFVQELTSREGRRLRVRGGFVDVHMGHDGKVFSVNSTLRYGRRKIDLDGIHGEEQAIAAAKAHLEQPDSLFGMASYETEQAELVFSAHAGNIDPVYEVVLTSNEPTRGELGRAVVRLLVKAMTLEVVDVHDMLKQRRHVDTSGSGIIAKDNRKSGGKSGKNKTPTPTVGAQVSGNVLLRIPNSNKPITQQMNVAIIDSLPDPKVLRNDRIVMYVGSSRTPVKAKADGSYMYNPTDPEFSAVVTYFALMEQFNLYDRCGLKPQKRGALTVRVEDRSGRDNAYFDEQAYLIAILIGSGLHVGGLTRYIAHDIGVVWHENGHHIIYLQTPGQDLPGDEGSGSHEAVGDVLGTLLMDWWCRFKYAAELGTTITVADILADPRIIGAYAAPPRGIRIQNNKKRTPKDKTGEPHNDGLIIGGALADLLVAMVLDTNDIPGALEAFCRMSLAALSIVPAHKVTFRDLLNAYLTADQTMNSGANKQLITKAFADHGITLTSNQRGRNMPVIVVV